MCTAMLPSATKIIRGPAVYSRTYYVEDLENYYEGNF